MIFIKKEIDNLDINKAFVVFDFDRTMTPQNSETSWGILEQNDIIDKNYKVESKKLYEYYRKKEIDNHINDNEKNKLMEKWMDEQLALLMKYKVNEEIFNKLLNLTNKMELRNGLDDFLKKLDQLNVPVIIISAGLGNAVVKFLKDKNLLLNNITVISNILIFNENTIKIKNDKINSISKESITLPTTFLNQIKNKKQLLLFGDQISDLTMLNNFITQHKISTCFLASDTKIYIDEYIKHYDIIADENETFDNISKILIKK